MFQFNLILRTVVIDPNASAIASCHLRISSLRVSPITPRQDAVESKNGTCSQWALKAVSYRLPLHLHELHDRARGVRRVMVRVQVRVIQQHREAHGGREPTRIELIVLVEAQRFHARRELDCRGAFGYDVHSIIDGADQGVLGCVP